MPVVSRSNQLAKTVIRSPIVWGGLVALAFYSLVHAGVLNTPFVLDYFTGHWVPYLEVILFFVALADLILKAIDVAEQSSQVRRPMLEAVSTNGTTIETAQLLIDSLKELPSHRRTSFLGRRLREALEYVLRSRNAERLDGELNRLSDVDAGRSHDRNALVRICIWAIPILGFLGTVIGITLAVASLDPQALDTKLVTAGLAIAFNTTAVALSLSMILVLGQYAVDRMEKGLLAEVDDRAAWELANRFDFHVDHAGPHLHVLRRMSEGVIASTDRLAQRQAEIWHSSLEASQKKWIEFVSSQQGQLQSAFSSAIAEGCAQMTGQLAAAAHDMSSQHAALWSPVHQAVLQQAEMCRLQQIELNKQGEILLQVVQATGQIARLQDTLNANLASVATAQHFQETMASLSAALNLLHGKLGQVSAPPAIELPKKAPRSKVA